MHTVIPQVESEGWKWTKPQMLHLHFDQMIPCSMVKNSPHYEINETINIICFQKALECHQALKYSYIKKNNKKKMQQASVPNVEVLEKH